MGGMVMFTVDEVYEITDVLEHQANAELQKAVAFRDGYVKACEDFGREIRRLLYEQNEED